MESASLGFEPWLAYPPTPSPGPNSDPGPNQVLLGGCRRSYATARMPRGLGLGEASGTPAHAGVVELERRQLELLTRGQRRQPAGGCGDGAKTRGHEQQHSGQRCERGAWWVLERPRSAWSEPGGETARGVLVKLSNEAI